MRPYPPSFLQPLLPPKRKKPKLGFSSSLPLLFLSQFVWIRPQSNRSVTLLPLLLLWVTSTPTTGKIQPYFSIPISTFFENSLKIHNFDRTLISFFNFQIYNFHVVSCFETSAHLKCTGIDVSPVRSTMNGSKTTLIFVISSNRTSNLLIL